MSVLKSISCLHKNSEIFLINYANFYFFLYGSEYVVEIQLLIHCYIIVI